MLPLRKRLARAQFDADTLRVALGRLEAQRRQAQRRLDALGLDVRSEVRIAKAQLDLNRHAAER